MGKMSLSTVDFPKKKKRDVHHVKDPSLNEFLRDREDQKIIFEKEKREIVENYERRITYLKNIIEEYDHKTNDLKLNLDHEKEKNLIHKTRILELEEQENLSQANNGYHNGSFEVELNNYENISEQNIADERHYDRIESLPSNSRTLLTDNNPHDIHQNCKEEFNILLEQLCSQRKKFEHELEMEREYMERRIEDEKIQIEKIVFKQLNQRLDREIKRREMLNTEKNHLERTISNTIIDSISEQFKKKKDLWKERNSDSGADVRSDDESDISNLSKCSDKHFYSHDDIASGKVISKILQEQKVRLTANYQRQLIKEKNKFRTRLESLRTEVIRLSEENEHLKDIFCNEYFDTISNFHNELSDKLVIVEEYLKDECNISDYC